jgi:hypothetical protein
MSPYIVEIESGVYLAPWKGDPGRTLNLASAKVFTGIQRATLALARARGYSDFKDARLLEVCMPEAPSAEGER